MRYIQNNILSVLLIAFLSISVTSFAQEGNAKDAKAKKEKKKKKRKKYKLPEIDLSHWKVTTPSGDGKKPMEFEPPEILNYGSIAELKPYMYNDSTKGALVFYAFPSGATTKNTKYSRSELREQMVPGSNKVNWTFAQGGYMKGTLQMGKITRKDDGKYPKVIIMQIHGRLTNEQRDLIGQDDNNAPPILKIYWQNGKIRVKTKVLKNKNASDLEILHEDAWGDDKGYTFKQEVGFKKFTLEVTVTDGKMVVTLNNHEYAVYEDINMKRWGIFENYFKAGNYFQSREEGTSAEVKYYSLEVSH
ncbi:polysaccharide lyase family 7 protein [Bizionia sp. KMM 8389]